MKFLCLPLLSAWKSLHNLLYQVYFLWAYSFDLEADSPNKITEVCTSSGLMFVQIESNVPGSLIFLSFFANLFHR